MAARGGGRPEGDRECQHEIRAALFGIEASAEGLYRHRDRMSAAQHDELARCLASEVRRVRRLIDGHTGDDGAFDLADAVAPAVASARACGLDVSVTVPSDLVVDGRRDATTQVVLALLDNARVHAAPSPAAVHAATRGGVVRLYVEDRGPGIGVAPRWRIFEPGVRAGASAGCGLGLSVAHRLMAEQGGSIEARARSGGGTSFVLRFRTGDAPATGSRPRPVAVP